MISACARDDHAGPHLSPVNDAELFSFGENTVDGYRFEVPIY